MQKPDDIPEDIWADAEALARKFGEKGFFSQSPEPIAYAILGERRRCLEIMSMKMPVVLGPNDWTNYVVGPFPEELLRSKV